MANFNRVSADYFETLGVSLTRGRAFTADDRAGGLRVAVVNETFVKQYLGDVDPLVQRVVLSADRSGAGSPGTPIEWQIVGVHADVRGGGPREGPVPAIAVPFSQSPWPSARIAVRTAGDPAHLQGAIADVVHSLNPDLPMGDVRTMKQVVGEAMASDRFHMALFAGFAAVALLLAAIGIYGVTSFAVAQRTREIGIRKALGADRGHILRQVLREGMTTGLAGAALGCVGAYLVGRAMQGMLYGVDAVDPTALGAVSLTLLGAAFLACLIPARRAASIDPVVALRQE
jgi:putative ABC transport system permease protein